MCNKTTNVTMTTKFRQAEIFSEREKAPQMIKQIIPVTPKVINNNCKIHLYKSSQ